MPLLRTAKIGKLKAVCVGAAGMLAAPEAARVLAQRLCAHLPAESVAVASDAVTSHAGALAGKAGVVLAVGTGAVAIAIGPGGVLHRADGWGPRLGDEGGGAWLGLEGLRAALRATDGRGPATTLMHAAVLRFGVLTGLSALMEGHDNAPGLAATFAPDIYHHAEAGDAIAAGLIRQAAAALAATAAAAAFRLVDMGPVPFAAVGGLLNLGPLLTVPLLATLHTDMPWLEHASAHGTSLDGALLLAADHGTVHEPTLVRVVAMECAAGLPFTAVTAPSSNKKVKGTLP